MSIPKLQKGKLKLLILLLVAAAGGLFLMIGPPQLLAKSETPLFCASCHVMQSQYEAWFNVGAHRTIKCVDCHLPHQNIGVHYLRKSLDGLTDVVVFYSGRAPETITISQRQQRVIQSNCVRCHLNRVERIDQERQCWGCHRWLQHRLAGTRMTS